MTKQSDYAKVLPHPDSLDKFVRSLAEFDRRFCDLMAQGGDFTLKIEIHGNKGELIHARVMSDNFQRPCGVEKRVDGKGR